MSEVVEMIRVQFDYMDGKLSLREALDAFEECGSDCTRGATGEDAARVAALQRNKHKRTEDRG